MHQEYIKEIVDFPQITINHKCKKRIFVLSKGIDYRYYKANYDQKENNIYICSKLLTDVLDLKENLDRELVMAYDHNIRKKDFKNDDHFAISAIRACRKQYDNFTQFNDEIKKKSAILCAQYLMKVSIIYQINSLIFC